MTERIQVRKMYNIRITPEAHRRLKSLAKREGVKLETLSDRIIFEGLRNYARKDAAA